MITLHVTGGLGNQLFNYAAARSLADRNNDTDLLIDVAAYRGASLSRPFLLREFPNLRARFRNMNRNTTPIPLVSRVARRVREDVFAKKVTRGYESVGYFPEFDALGRRVVLKGHYIDRRFFDWNEARILRDLALPPDFLSMRSDLLGVDVYARIHASGVPVSVHVRRGDFLAPHARWLLLPNVQNYYFGAMRRIDARIGAEAVFWVFSDDIEWCRQAFSRFPYRIEYVDQFPDGDTNPLREFFLMSTCRHHIIANSSFSLWSARLSQGDQKGVLCPDRWDGEGRVNLDSVVPKHWEKVSWACLEE